LLSWRPLTSTPISANAVETWVKSSTVSGRKVFYNNSKFDGNSTAANAADDAAIATDKSALLPGLTANAQNYTSFSKGINGIMLDMPGLPAGAGPGASDFDFKIGNNNLPGGWGAAPAPSSVTTRRGAGVNGSDRITLIWTDGVIKTAEVLTGEPRFAQGYQELVKFGYPEYTLRQKCTFPPGDVLQFLEHLAFLCYPNLLKYEPAIL